MPLSDKDHRLSMLVSRRGQNDANRILRSLLLHRLRHGLKAVLRLPLRNPLDADPPRYGRYCELCDHWANDVPSVDPTFTCTRCGTRYAVECVIYAAVPPAD